jgi:hypothetical protein
VAAAAAAAVVAVTARGRDERRWKQRFRFRAGAKCVGAVHRGDGHEGGGGEGSSPGVGVGDVLELATDLKRDQGLMMFGLQNKFHLTSFLGY